MSNGIFYAQWENVSKTKLHKRPLISKGPCVASCAMNQ